MSRKGVVERVDRLPSLEEDVGVLRRASQHRPVGGQSSLQVLAHETQAEERLQVVVGEIPHLLQLVAGSEAVEEMEERHAAAKRRSVGDRRQVVGLLGRIRGQHREARRAAGHDVAVVPEDGQGVSRHSAGGDVHDERRQLAGDLEHVGDHQEEALRRGERRGQGALLQRAVGRAGGAGFGLHLDDVGHGAPQVRLACGGPVVAMLGHLGSGRDRVDRDHLGQGVRDTRGRLVAVDGLPVLTHRFTASFRAAGATRGSGGRDVGAHGFSDRIGTRRHEQFAPRHRSTGGRMDRSGCPLGHAEGADMASRVVTSRPGRASA